MKNNNLFSYKPKNPNQKIWQVYPDPKSNFIVLEIREAKKSELIILDSQKKEVFANAEMEATQTLLNFFDKTILLSEIDFQNEMPLAKGLQALDLDFEVSWELEEVIYYGIVEENQSQKNKENQNETKVILTLQSNYYSVPLKINQNQKNKTEQEIEAKEENYDNLNHKIKQYFYSTNEYITNHTNYNDISDFIFKKTNHKTQNSVFYTENEEYLICSYLVDDLTENEKFDNYLLCTDKKGNLKTSFLIKENTKNPQELILMQNKIFWINENEFHFLLI